MSSYGEGAVCAPISLPVLPQDRKQAFAVRRANMGHGLRSTEQGGMGICHNAGSNIATVQGQYWSCGPCPRGRRLCLFVELSVFVMMATAGGYCGHSCSFCRRCPSCCGHRLPYLGQCFPGDGSHAAARQCKNEAAQGVHVLQLQVSGRGLLRCVKLQHIHDTDGADEDPG